MSDIANKTGSAVTITSSGASLTAGSAGSAGTIDLRSGGTTNLVEQLMAFMELTAQWATVSGIAAGYPVADCYLVPALDGTNFVDVDTTASVSFISTVFRVGVFEAAKIPTASVNMRFATALFELFPALYTAYIINRTGQTMSANWSLKILTDRAQVG